MTAVDAYPGRLAAAACKISYRQLDYWARTDLVRPSLVDADGSGSRRLYSRGDLIELRIIAELLRDGLRLEQLRTVMDGIRTELRWQSPDRLAAALLVVPPTDPAVLVWSAETLVQAVRLSHEAVIVLPLSRVIDGLDDDLAEAQAWRFMPAVTTMAVAR